MSNESNQVFAAPGIYYISPQEKQNQEEIDQLAEDLTTLETRMDLVEGRVTQLEFDVIALEDEVKILNSKFEEKSVSTIWDNGTNTSSSIFMEIQRTDKTINITLPLLIDVLSGTPGTVYVSNPPLDIQFRPSVQLIMQANVITTDATIEFGIVTIRTNGNIEISKDLAGNLWTVGGTRGWFGFSFSYNLA